MCVWIKILYIYTLCTLRLIYIVCLLHVVLNYADPANNNYCQLQLITITRQYTMSWFPSTCHYKLLTLSTVIKNTVHWMQNFLAWHVDPEKIRSKVNIWPWPSKQIRSKFFPIFNKHNLSQPLPLNSFLCHTKVHN